jgi:anti-sigma regulatory factor (Ser/Thr protein kinase)
LFEGQLSAEELGRVRRQLTSWARGAGLDPDTADAVTLGGYEALANTVEHAYREEGHGQVEVRAIRVDRVVTLTVTDHGRWRTPNRDRGTRGHGLTLIRELGDYADVAGTPTGTTVRMTWLLAS